MKIIVKEIQFFELTVSPDEIIDLALYENVPCKLILLESREVKSRCRI